jgi:hypothetical protein
MWDVFRVELLFDAGFADDEDGAFHGRELWVGFREDAGDVDGGAVGGAEDLFDSGGDAHGREFVSVVGAGFGGVVGYEDDGFVLGAEEVESPSGLREEGVAGPEDACEVGQRQLESM